MLFIYEFKFYLSEFKIINENYNQYNTDLNLQLNY
jgi:hypothetical protein